MIHVGHVTVWTGDFNTVSCSEKTTV